LVDKLIKAPSGAIIFEGGVQGPGTVPLGAIIAIASNLTGAHTIPATGTVDSNGFQYCDGAAIAGSATMSGTIYNLTDSRFLMGSTSAGGVGGQTNVTLITANMPSHTHGMQSHTHTMQDHTHSGTSASQSANHTHSTTLNTVTGNLAAGGFVFLSRDFVSQGTQDYGSGAISAGHTHTLTTGGPSNNTTAGPSNNTTTSTGSGTAYENRPLYLAVQYVMRVK